MSVKVTWHGADVKRDVHQAERRGLEQTAAAAVARAKSSHPSWKSDTGEAERSIEALPTEAISGGFRQEIGSRLGRFLFLEVGARGRPGDSTIRRAVDVEGGNLGDRIAQAVR